MKKAGEIVGSVVNSPVLTELEWIAKLGSVPYGDIAPQRSV